MISDTAANAIGVPPDLCRVLAIPNPFHDVSMMRRINYYSRLSRLVLCIQEQGPDTVINLSWAARIACMEKSAFSRFFKRASGMTFSIFVQRWRISLAVERMLLADSSLTDIAYHVGFGSLSSFERIFRNVTGETPSSYRKRILSLYGITKHLVQSPLS